MKLLQQWIWARLLRLSPRRAQSRSPKACFQTGQRRGTERHLAGRAQQRFTARARYERRMDSSSPPHGAHSGW